MIAPDDGNSFPVLGLRIVGSTIFDSVFLQLVGSPLYFCVFARWYAPWSLRNGMEISGQSRTKFGFSVIPAKMSSMMLSALSLFAPTATR